MRKNILPKLVIASAAMVLCSCGNSKTSDGPEEKLTTSTVYAVDYGVTTSLSSKEEVSGYMTGIANDNRPVENGVILSPYFSNLIINGAKIPVYATRTANTVHSFAYVDIEKTEQNLRTKLEVSFETSDIKTSIKKVEVLPLSTNVEAKYSKKKVTATIKDTGNYSFVFNGKQAEALTLMIANKDKKENHLEGDVARTITEIEPGSYYDSTNLNLTESNTLYFFKKGRYQIGSINIPNNSALYFEEGAYLELYPDNKSPITCNGVSNIGVYGHALVDYSPCNGSQLNAPKDDRVGKGGLSFNSSDKIDINGLMIINAGTWQCCLGCSTDIHITNCMFYGYRTYADGIMLNNCQNAVVEHNFIRTGDDAFETKSTSGDMLTKNVVFQYNSAWTDKAVAYGCIYESKNDTSDVHFLHNSVGFASGSWSKHLGCAVVQMGNNPEATMHDIEFDDMEIYYSCNQALCNIYIGGSGGMGAGYGTVKDIYFKNIKCENNTSYMLNLQTYDDENCFIKRVYMENIVSGGVRLTAENYKQYCCLDAVAGGYNPSNLNIDGVKCK